MKAIASKQGFTLIELLVVVSIISLLASILLVAVKTARATARDDVRRDDIAQIQKALELYYADNGQYPLSGGATQPNGAWDNSADASWNTLQTALAKYLNTLPKDPLENNNANEWGQTGYHFSYFDVGYGCPGQQYMLVYQTEVAISPDIGQSFCDGSYWVYGSTSTPTTIRTIGQRARQ